MPGLDRTKIPARWAQDAHWVVWRYELTDTGTLTKVPYDPLKRRKASSTNSHTWSTLAVCERALAESDGHYAGLGHMQSEDDPSVGIDYDHCLDDEGRIIESWVEAEILLLDSWTYVTPSGESLRVIVDGTWHDRGRKKPGIEVYARDRFFTVTDNLYGGSRPIIFQRQAMLDSLHDTHFAPPPALKRQLDVSDWPHEGAPRAEHETYSDDQAINLLYSFPNVGRKINDLMLGSWEAWYASESEADAGLAWYIQLVASDEAQILRILRQSGLWDEKWERPDYQRATLDFIAQRAEHYSPPPSRFTRHPRPERPESLNGQVDVSDYVAKLEASHALLEEQVDALLAEIAGVRAHFTRMMQLTANGGVPLADRAVLMATLNQTSSLISREQADESGRVHTSPTQIAEAAGVSAKTAGKVIQQYAEMGILDRQLTRTPKPCTRDGDRFVDTETGEIYDKQPWISELRVGVPKGTDATAELLATMDATVVSNGTIKKQGGKRDPRPATCPEHPDADVNILEVIECAECETEVRRTHKKRIGLKRQLVISENNHVSLLLDGTLGFPDKNGVPLERWGPLELPSLGASVAAGAG